MTSENLDSFQNSQYILLEYSNILAPKIILEMSIEFNIKEKIYIILCTFFTVLKLNISKICLP